MSTPTPNLQNQSTKVPVPTRLKHRSRNKAVPLVMGIVLIGLGVWWGWRVLHPAESSTAGLITDTVKVGDLIETVSATGSVNAQTGAQVKIGSQVTGRIKKLNADVGSQVKAGQIIAELDLPDVQAQLDQAKANLSAARIKLAQQQSGVSMQQIQTLSAIAQAEAARRSAVAKLRSAQSAADLQIAQTPTEIQISENSVASSIAALSTAKSNLTQIQAGADLQVANSQLQITQAEAIAANSDLNLKRQLALVEKGFVAVSVADQARATAVVNQSLVIASKQNMALVQQKVTADLQAGKNLITQAEQNVKASQAALTAAKAGKFLDAVKLAGVGDARAALSQEDAALTIAKGNSAQNLLKQQDVSQAQAAVLAVEEQVAFAQAQVNKTYIRSPISGTVLQMAAQQGETLAAGLSSPTLIVVADLTRLQVDTYVDETDIGKVQLGQSTLVTVDAFPKTKFRGHVSKIASGSTIQQGVITYDVTVALDKPEHQLKPDMTASVTIQIGKKTGVLLVPAEAVKTGGSGTSVLVLTIKDGKSSTESRKVNTGGTDGVNTEILSGLKEGDTIVLAGAIKTTDPKRSTSPFGGGVRGGGGGGPPR